MAIEDRFMPQRERHVRNLVRSEKKEKRYELTEDFVNSAIPGACKNETAWQTAKRLGLV